jgi:phosphoglycerate kinase
MKGLGKMKTKKIILGGGDTVAVAENVLKKNKTLKFTHVSTGGGAMIDFLSNGNLPGLKVLS